MQVTFRPILEQDVEQLKDIALKTFSDSYRHLNTVKNFDWYIQRAFTTDKLVAEINNKDSYYYIVMYGNHIAGYLKLNIEDSQTEIHTDEYLEIERIYIQSKYKKKGLGRRMMEFVFDHARSLSKTKVWLGVWDQNPSAIQFYKHIGFQTNGSHIFRFGDEDQIDLIMEIEVD